MSALRTGNLVLYKNDTQKITEILKDNYVSLTNVKTKISIKDLQFIVLTDELLMNNGFEQAEHEKRLFLALELEGNPIQFLILEKIKSGYSLTCPFIRGIKYIHEIQNIFYEIMAKDLKLINVK